MDYMSKITGVRLWKKNDKDKWISYNGSFPTSPDSSPDNYMQCIRLIKRGWIPYADNVKNPEKSKPVYIGQDDVDISVYEKKLKDLDPVGHQVGEAWLEFSRTWGERRKKEKDVDEHLEPVTIFERKDVQKLLDDAALKAAVEDYKAGKRVPKFILSKVFEYLCKQKT